MKTILFTDLDGTLLDPVDYSPKAAEPALALLKQRGVPVVFVSSKTRAEIEVWRTRLGNTHPFVVENGGGVYVPRNGFRFPVEGSVCGGYCLVSLGRPYEEIRSHLIELRDRLKIDVRGFGDMTPEEVASLTGLSIDDAILARERDFSEPFIFPGAPDERFLQAIEGQKLRWTQGRFFHIMGNHHKGRAVEILRDLYVREGDAVRTIGIGDSLNDLPMLLAVDNPVIVRKKSGKHDQRIDIPGLFRTKGTGPEGWSEAVFELMKP